MSVRANATPGSSARAASSGRPETEQPDPAGLVLGRLSVLPALLVMAWLLVGLPLLFAGVFTPVTMLVVSVPVAVVLVALGLRWIPGRWHGAWLARGPERARTPWWAVAGVIAVAVAFGVE